MSLWRGAEEGSGVGKLGFPGLGPHLPASVSSVFDSHWISKELSGWWEIGPRSVGQEESKCHGLEQLASLL